MEHTVAFDHRTRPRRAFAGIGGDRHRDFVPCDEVTGVPVQPGRVLRSCAQEERWYSPSCANGMASPTGSPDDGRRNTGMGCLLRLNVRERSV